MILKHPVPATVGNLLKKVPRAKLRETHTLDPSILMDCLLIGIKSNPKCTSRLYKLKAWAAPARWAELSTATGSAVWESHFLLVTLPPKPQYFPKTPPKILRCYSHWYCRIPLRKRQGCGSHRDLRTVVGKGLQSEGASYWANQDSQDTQPWDALPRPIPLARLQPITPTCWGVMWATKPQLPQHNHS